MTVDKTVLGKVRLIADQLWMFSKNKREANFWDLSKDDKDLTMFSVINLNLSSRSQVDGVEMNIVLKRKATMELMTTYLPTLLLLLLTFSGTFFKVELFGDAMAHNLTIMLVMTTIFTSKIEELPPTSDMKMIDVWLIFCLVVPFFEVILRTAIECMNCSCHICEPKDANKAKSEKEEKKNGADAIQGASSGEVTCVWVGTGAKVAPQQVSLK